MLPLLFNGEYALFIMILIAIVISLSFHEFGHAVTALYFGDDTPKRMGRVTLNPAAHVDPFGLLMVATVGFGYAKPVMTDPRNFKSFWADLFVSAAGPGMNLLLAILAINFFQLAVLMQWEPLLGQGPAMFFTYLALINLILMIFNLIPIGALDGHYILPYFLPRPVANRYRQWNHQYGNYFLLGLILLSVAGIPVFRFVWGMGESMLPYITFIRAY